MKAGEIVTVAISLVSLAVSVLTAWLTLFLQGKVRMTRPNVIGFAREGMKHKIFLRFLLYSTPRRGNIVESMHLIFSQNGKNQLFSSWGYGDSQTSLVRGSGLFVGPEGVAINHHFVATREEEGPTFGECRITVYASILGEKQDRQLHSMRLSINQIGDAVLYDWDPELKDYHPNLV